ncbi:SpoIIE family protein phosphatase [Streptomyces sp. M-16]|uniref:PP2C family protein-serine/threonine phosphatase n=1 Tax=Streptomyces sp. M-16 TaxID=3233040 RepID=UPI002252AFE1
MDSDAASVGNGTAPEVLALARTVARLRSEVVDLKGAIATAVVVERAEGVLMGRLGISAEAAHERLVEHAARRGRSVLEECWITLGRAGADSPPPSPPDPPVPVPVPVPTPTRSSPRTRATPGPTAAATLLARLAEGLVCARTGDDVAELLRGELAQAQVPDLDAVMIYVTTPGGTLELVGHAGVGDVVAGQWRHLPPLVGLAVLQALTGGEPVWLQDPVRDARHHLLIGPPDRWPARAWLPLSRDGLPGAVIGFLRTGPGPFDPPTRDLLRRAVRLCGGPLRAFEHSGPTATGNTAEPGGAPVDADAVQRVLDALSAPTVLLTPLRGASGEVEDYRIDAAAPDSVDVAGRRGRELVGLRVLETYPTVAGTAVWDGYLDALTTGRPYESEPFIYEEVLAGVPKRSVYTVRATVLGEHLVVSWVRHDGDEREARRLADMQRLGNLGWAGWNPVARTAVWSEQVYAIFDRDPVLGPVGLEDLPRHLPTADRPAVSAALARLLDRAEPVDEVFRITTAHGVRHVRMVAEAQPDADGRAVEVHGLLQDVTARQDAERALLESERDVLVQRGRFEAERALAARLQNTLLPIPEQSLELAGLCVDVAYAPADSGINVGGDWYSAIELPDRSALFVVGDVAGHGLPAVGTMAQLRFTTKGMTVTGSALPDVLARLNRLLLHTAADPSSGGATATMVMGRYRPSDRRLTWVRAGHLPPLLIRGDEAGFLPQPKGVLLGAAFGSEYGQSVTDLLPGDHLLLYTDGLVEEPGEDIGTGLARLADTALRLVREGRGETLARTLAALRPRHRDDICVLHLRVPDDA